MKCSEFEETIPQLAGNGLMEAGAQTAALEHAEACARCASRLADERVLVSGVRAVRAEFANEQAPAHLEQVLLSAFRERHQTLRTPLANSMPEARVLPSNKAWLSWKFAAIAAAILLLASIGTIVLVRSGSREAPPRAKIYAPPSIPESPALITDVKEPGNHAAAIKTPPRRVKRPARRTETVTEYFPLIAGDDLESLEFTQVVRVELSASALRDVGLPLSYVSDGGPVKADVVLGHDGMARAIRFVR